MSKKQIITLLCVHILLGLITLKDILIKPFTHVVGHSDSDLYPHLWGYWRWIRKWREGGFIETWSNAEPYLNAPYTGDLYHVDWLNGCIVWIGTSIGMPLLMSVNTMILIQWLLMGLGTILLSKRLNLTIWGTLFVLCSLDTTPFIERFVLHSAVFERLNLGWLLLYLWCLLGLIEEKNWHYAIAAIGFFGLTVLGSWHYALFAVLSSIWIGLWYLIKDRSLLKYFVGLTIGCASIAYPISRRAQSSLQDSSIIEHKAQRFWDWSTPLEVLNDFQWTDLFLPTVKQSFGFDVLEESIFIGWAIPIGWFAYIITKRIRTYDSWLWLMMSLYFSIISLGPNITLWKDWTITSPLYYATAGLVPYFSTMEVPWEYSWMALLTGSILCALLFHKHARYAWIPSVCILIQHQIYFPQTIANTAPIQVDKKISDVLQTNFKNVFNYPLNNHQTSNTQSPHHEYLWLQTYHERPIAYGIQQSWLHQTELWRQLDEATRTANSWTEIRQQCQLQACQSGNTLRKELTRFGFQQFVLHLNFIESTDHQAQVLLWQKVFGPPLVQSDTHVVYTLDLTRTDLK